MSSAEKGSLTCKGDSKRGIGLLNSRKCTQLTRQLISSQIRAPHSNNQKQIIQIGHNRIKKQQGGGILQLAIYKHGRGFELRTTENKSSNYSQSGTRIWNSWWGLISAGQPLSASKQKLGLLHLSARGRRPQFCCSAAKERLLSLLYLS